MAAHPPHVITVSLTEEERTLIELLARERGLNAPEDVLLALLHEAVQAHDALWDDAFARSQDTLDRLADEAHAEYAAGLTEEFDPDIEPDAS